MNNTLLQYWNRSDTKELFRRFVMSYKLIGRFGRRLFWYSYTANTVSTFLNTASYIFVAMLLLVLSNTDIINTNKYFATVKNFLGFDEKTFLIFLCSLLIVYIIFDRVISFLLSIYMASNNHKFANYFSGTLYAYYLTQDYCYSPQRDCNNLIKNVQNAPGVIHQSLFPLANTLILLINLGIIITGLVIINPIVTIAMGLGIATYYFVYHQLASRRLNRYGKAINDLSIGKIKLLRTGISPFSDIMFEGRELEFRNHFNQLADKQRFFQLRMHIIKSATQPLLRMFAMVFVCIIAIYLISTENAQTVLPTVAVFITIGLRLIPLTLTLQSLLLNVQSQKHIFYDVFRDAEKAFKIKEDLEQLSQVESLGLQKLLSLKNISYHYPDQKEPALEEINLDLPAGKRIALCGLSGSGKTTLARIICGLVSPSGGQVLVDGQDIWSDLNLRRRWHASVGMMQQQPFFLNDTIAANVAFSTKVEAIDFKRVEEMLKVAQLYEFVHSLPDGVNTIVGENALQLSGGQAQRVSIARALYSGNPLLILDETTNALDAVTEKKILDDLATFGDLTVVIIAHRLEIMKDVDCIYVMNHGRMIADGTYGELIKSCDLFKQLARLYSEMKIDEQEEETPDRAGQVAT